MMSTVTLTAVIYWEDDGYVAQCPELGTASEGDTIEEALAHLQEATEMHLKTVQHVAPRQLFITRFEASYTPFTPPVEWEGATGA